MSKTGAAERAHAAPQPLAPPASPAPDPVPEEPATSRLDASGDDFFIPDFCAARMVFAVVLLSELLAVTLSLARPTADFLSELARVSMFLQWMGLTSAALLCYLRSRLRALTIAQSSLAVFGVLLTNTVVISVLALWFGTGFDTGAAAAVAAQSAWPFVARNAGICVIVTALLLRYFFVTHQWQTHVRAEARSRIQALQARIRPHFLFNSMNTIAALTRSDPARAEEAVEDLADLFRATLRDSHSPLRLKEELELTRIYQRIEALRLGERLKVTWDVAGLPMRALVPGLTVQPLLENAIYHGIEPLPGGGTVTIAGRVANGEIELVVTNPVAPGRGANDGRPGNRLALDNIRQRLTLAYGGEGVLSVEQSPDQYRVTVRFPYTE
ncbi:MAG TPA: histidine kinase [Gammaproteobacteria bacterium]|jgi:two-component system sensor histidine kinase AlgZ|nr:histidine kinase [Gammaproteobacteria bacterium]